MFFLPSKNADSLSLYHFYHFLLRNISFYNVRKSNENENESLTMKKTQNIFFCIISTNNIATLSIFFSNDNDDDDFGRVGVVMMMSK